MSIDAPRYRLVGIGTCTKGMIHDLADDEPAVLGRNADCAIPIPRASGATGTVPISRHHAVVERTPDKGWSICDSGSTNGTALLRQGRPPTIRLEPAQWYPLRPGDVIELAGSPDYEFMFQAVPRQAAVTQLLLRTGVRAVQQLVDGHTVVARDVGPRGLWVNRQPVGRLWLEAEGNTASAVVRFELVNGAVFAGAAAPGARVNQRPISPGVQLVLRDKDIITVEAEPDTAFLFLDPDAVEPRSLSDLLLGAHRVTFGTADDNTCRLADPSISRHHAVVWRDGRELSVRDLGSANGTVVNDRRIVDDCLLTPGTRLWFGRLPFLVDEACWREAPSSEIAVDIRFVNVAVEIAGKLRLRDVSLTVRQGEMVGVLGPSASGKSTLLRALAGQQRLANGDIYVNGRSVTGVPQYRDLLKGLLGFGPDTREVGFVQQIDLLQPGLTVREILQFAARQMGLSSADAGARADYVAGLCNLGSHLERVALSEQGQLHLSGGQLKRVCVALEVLRQPRVLVLDEPTTGQDPKNTNDLMNLFRRLAQEDVTLLMSTHDLRNLALFDKVVVLCLGYLAYFGPPEGLAGYFGAGTAEDVYASLPDKEERLLDAQRLADTFRAHPLYHTLCGVEE